MITCYSCLQQQYYENDEEVSRGDEDVVVVYPTEEEREYVQISRNPGNLGPGPFQPVGGPSFQNIPQPNPSEQRQNDKQRCLEPHAIDGVCYASVERWTYNALTGKCQPFSYGGCGGNGNNFVNRIECEYSK